MKKLRLILVAVIGALTLNTAITSCIDDNNVAEEANDLYIGSIRLGNLKRTTRYINAKGHDTTTVVTVNGANYGLTIDQTPGADSYCRIYNVDSLPKNTDMQKVVFSVLQAYNGIVAIDRVKPTATEKDTAFVLTDSTDFSRKRYFTLYGRDQVSRRTYEVDLRVHSEYGDSLRWQLQGINPEVAAMTQTKAHFCRGEWYLFGTKAGQLQVVTPTQTLAVTTNIDPRSVAVYDNTFYALAEGHLVASTNGSEWHKVDGAPLISNLFGVWSQGLVAYTRDGKVVRSLAATQWVTDNAEDNFTMPDTEVTAVAKFKDSDRQLEDIILVGQKDGATHLWKNTVEHHTDGSLRDFGWVYLPQGRENTYPCPLLRQPSLINYDNGALLIGTGLDSDTICNPLLSQDYGRTWKRHPNMDFKMAFGTNVLPHPSATPAVAVALSDDKYVWVFCQQTGEIWRGRINRLGWKKEQTSFLKTQHR